MIEIIRTLGLPDSATTGDIAAEVNQILADLDEYTIQACSPLSPVMKGCEARINAGFDVITSPHDRDDVVHVLVAADIADKTTRSALLLKAINMLAANWLAEQKNAGEDA